MEPHTRSAPPPAIPEPGSAWRVGACAAAMLLGPALMLWHLHGLWNPDGSYAYGWAVPLLAACLFWFRWEDRPAPGAPLRWASPAALLMALLTLPALWLQEAAPERALCTWLYAGGCVGVSFAIISTLGGGRWLRWFGFPLAFLLTAVPWPHAAELLISNILMHGTARVTTEILCLIGIPSAQAGNLVHIETGVIDIDEACSGIRSLQAMVMISLFLGELFRLKLPRRLLLTALGLSFTLLANILRTVTLGRIGFTQGMDAVDRFHDTAGLAVLLLSLATTLGAAILLRPRKTHAAPAHASPGIRRDLPLKLCSLLLIWFFVEETAVEAWYRSREPQWHGWSWTVQWPLNAPGFHTVDIPLRSTRLLMCDDARAAAWQEPAGASWSLYSVRWNPGNPEAEAAKVHRPDVCLNAEGALMEKDLGSLATTAGGMRLPFHCYTFLLGEQRLYVFFCLREETGDASPDDAIPRFEQTGMLQRAWDGRRRIGLQSLELALSGYPSDTAAEQAFRARIGTLIQSQTPPPPTASAPRS